MSASNSFFSCGQDCSDCCIEKQSDTISKRGIEWMEFSTKVFSHIENYTVPQYGDKPNDQVEGWAPEQCVKQMGKYIARFESNQRGQDERLRDMLKVAHYSCLAWHKLQDG